MSGEIDLVHLYGMKIDELHAQIRELQAQALASQRETQIQRTQTKFWKDQNERAAAMALQLSLRLESTMEIAREAIDDKEFEIISLKNENAFLESALKDSRKRSREVHTLMDVPSAPRKAKLAGARRTSSTDFFSEK